MIALLLFLGQESLTEFLLVLVSVHDIFSPLTLCCWCHFCSLSVIAAVFWDMAVCVCVCVCCVWNYICEVGISIVF